MSIFGSYIDKRYRLTGEALRIAGLDTLVAFMAGLIIFPACFAFGVEPGSGPGLVFITLPSVFNADAGRAAVGHAVLPVHELRGAVHGDRGVREHHELQHGRVGLVAQQGCAW